MSASSIARQDGASAGPPFSSSPRLIAIVLGLLSFATVLFTLALFRLLSFFIMPSLFFDLLFVGFPVGAFVAARYFRIDLPGFRRSIWLLLAAMAASVGAMFFCKHFDYLRAHLFQVRLSQLLIQMGTFTGLFLPFFVAYGLCEYIGYQVGRRHLARRMPLVYALYLFGAAAAYFVLMWLVPWIGVARLLCFAAVAVVFSAFVLSPPGAGRDIARAALIPFVVLLFIPQLERGFLALYKGDSFQSTRAYRKMGFRTVVQNWGKYSLTEVMANPSQNYFAGFYNDIFQWAYLQPHGAARESLGVVPLELLPDGATIAVIGSGGGRQVRYASQPRLKVKRIVALEIEPAVFQAVRGQLAGSFGHVYEQSHVQPVCAEARGYMERTTERFDLIYLPSVGGYPQMMLEPGNMVRTIDAYKTLRNRLTARGMLAIWYPVGLDPRGVLTRQYVLTLRTAELGMHVRAFRSSREYLILATPGPAERVPNLHQVRQALCGSPKGCRDFGRRGGRLPVDVDYGVPDSSFKPIRDDRPFLAGNVSRVLSLEQVTLLFEITAAAVLAVALLTLLGLKRAGRPQVPGRSYLQFAGVSFLIGANFLLIEHALIVRLFQSLYVYYDALVLGAVAFLILTGLGSMLLKGRHRTAALLACLGPLAALATLCMLHVQLPAWGILLAYSPLALVTGSFFPALFEAASRNPLAVFAFDAVGAAAGAMTAFFLPILFGFTWMSLAAVGLFLLTAVAFLTFVRGLPIATGADAATEDRPSSRGV